MDRDATPIGGLENPLQPTKQLFFVTIIIDAIAITASLCISIYFAIGVLLYILASRAYSYRGIRLKKYPVIGYLVVVLFQGALTFFISYHGCSADRTLMVPLMPMIAASCLIGGYYPLTQIYQHEEDCKDGVTTISYMLGKKGTFIFCGIIFALATLCMYLTFEKQRKIFSFWIFIACMAPMILFFNRWMLKVWKDPGKADFRNSFRMNILASFCTMICFIILIIIKLY